MLILASVPVTPKMCTQASFLIMSSDMRFDSFKCVDGCTQMRLQPCFLCVDAEGHAAAEQQHREEAADQEPDQQAAGAVLALFVALLSLALALALLLLQGVLLLIERELLLA